MTVAPGQHVPAWKRLGLTLKHAKDVPSSPQPANSLGEHSSPDPTRSKHEHKKSKRSHDDGDGSHSSKKRRVGSTIDPLSSPASKHSGALSAETPSKDSSSPRASPEKQIPSSIKKSPTKPRDRRKSVTFSQDTKTEDGDTAMNAFRDWVAEQNALEIEADAAKKREAASAPADVQSSGQSSEAPAEQTSTATSKPQASEKRSKSAKSTPDSTKAEKKVKTRTLKTAGDKPVPEYLKYLEQYHSDRPSWKFNKSKQNDLLKNVWSIYRVPSEHNDALVEYVSGLQGAARQRLQDSARTIITETVTFIRSEIPESKADAMDTVEARKAAFAAAEKQELERLTASGQDLGKGDERVQTLRQKQQEDERATRLLAALLGDSLTEVKSTSSAGTIQPVVETARQRKKKRRTRTAASDSESSSDDSDSDSDGGASSKKSKGKKQVGKGGEDNSSSSSDCDSSSSSSSESDDSDSDGSSSSDDSSSDNTDSESD